MSAPRIARHRHFLGDWNAPDRIRVRENDALRPPREDELAAIVADDTSDAIAAMTCPTKIRKQLWELDWEEGAAMTPSDRDAFEKYGQRVLGFFRAAGVPLAEPCETKLVASAPGHTTIAEGPARGVVIVNVGESDFYAGRASAFVRIPPGEACVVPSQAYPYEIVTSQDAEFVLVLELSPLTPPSPNA